MLSSSIFHLATSLSKVSIQGQPQEYICSFLGMMNADGYFYLHPKARMCNIAKIAPVQVAKSVNFMHIPSYMIEG